MSELNIENISEVMKGLAPMISLISNDKLRLSYLPSKNEDKVEYALHLTSISYEEFIALAVNKQENIVLYMEKMLNIVNGFLVEYKEKLAEDRFYHKDMLHTDMFILTRKDGGIKGITFKLKSEAESSFKVH